MRIRTVFAACAAMASLALATNAHGYVIKKTSDGELVHWDERRVTYTLDPRLDANVSSATRATRDAMRSWSGAVGAPDLSPTAREDAPTRPEFDGKNGIFFMPNGYAPAGRALAITVLTYDNGTGSILDADIIFNGSYRFAVLESEPVAPERLDGLGPHPSATDEITHAYEPPSTTEATYDLHHVVAHELGHSLGMNDEMERKDALMYRYTAPNDPTLREPARDDISGLAELYATKLEGRGNGCGGANVAPKNPTREVGSLALAAGALLLVFLAARVRSRRGVRTAFVIATAAAALGLFPKLGGGRTSGVALANEAAPGHARARVLAAATTLEHGLMTTRYRVATTTCRTASCPPQAEGTAWGGVIGHVRQDVGGAYAPVPGDVVDVSFERASSALAPLSAPLGGAKPSSAVVRVLTKASD